MTEGGWKKETGTTEITKEVLRYEAHREYKRRFENNSKRYRELEAADRERCDRKVTKEERKKTNDVNQ